MDTIPPIPTEKTLRMGVVELAVADLTRMRDFYSEVVWFQVVSSTGNTVSLGESETVFLRLIAPEGYTRAPHWEAGLYHIAITHTSQKSLAERIRNIMVKNQELYQWSADHSATEAFYFADPEGNWLELYYDKPRTEWQYEDGKPVMGSSPLDTLAYINRYADMPVSGGVTSMGHVHLKVGSIEEAERFYRDILGFEVMKNMGTALFVSRDGYHHNLGLNTWESLGSKKRTQETYGLMSYELIYTAKLYEEIREKLDVTKIPYKENNATIIVDDPWGNTIKIRQV